ncbi:MAG TPA: nuclear transport factor 2 family protein [Vicinamibacterales bacterium]|nr:nuclear transport factor 2 family protein [Vicinamibacterales bacterium]
MAMILTLALALAHPGATDITEVTRELTRIERQLAATWKAGDCSAWGALLAAEWSVTHITGAVITKAEALQMCSAPAVPIDSFEVDEISVRAFGDAAVVTGRTKVITGGATPDQITLRFTDVFIRRAGQWLAVASHATRLGS